MFGFIDFSFVSEENVYFKLRIRPRRGLGTEVHNSSWLAELVSGRGCFDLLSSSALKITSVLFISLCSRYDY